MTFKFLIFAYFLLSIIECFTLSCIVVVACGGYRNSSRTSMSVALFTFSIHLGLWDSQIKSVILLYVVCCYSGHFCLECRTLVLIAQGPGHCLPFTFHKHFESRIELNTV